MYQNISSMLILQIIVIVYKFSWKTYWNIEV